MPYTISLIPGDGVGPEITEATRRVLEATGVVIDWDVQQIGEAALEK
ncbi:MAG: isocitrate/isopropylmalate dehydrogenase family protein, partial [Dehalococcoidia bacterium]